MSTKNTDTSVAAVYSPYVVANRCPKAGGLLLGLLMAGGWKLRITAALAAALMLADALLSHRL